ncbi:MAG: PilT/PilU family type 4a pilus ATPase [Pseudomonadota bacterium]
MNLEAIAQNLSRLGARALVLVSGCPAMLRFPSGDKYAQQSLTHDQLTVLLLESAPASAQADLHAGRPPAVFTVAAGGAAYRVETEGARGTWRVTITPDNRSGRPSADSQPPARVPAPPIARTEREPVAAPRATVQVSTKAPDQAPDQSPAEERRPPDSAPSREPEINSILRQFVKDKGSDVHLGAGLAPYYRVSGNVRPMPDREVLSQARLQAMLFEIMPERSRQEFEQTSDCDFAYAVPDLARFRCNVGIDRNGVFAVIRRIPFEILTPEQIGLPPKALDLCWLTKGLVVVTGPTGSGKSTTLATLVDVVNSQREDHIITIEDPIEFVHPVKKCLIRQREVGEHTSSFKRALKAALREDPNIVLVGEMRDLETIEIAIETAQTGHLVFGTLHTTTAPSTVDRIIDQFPADRQGQIRSMLAESLRGVIAQTLCKKVGGGRVAAYEILLGNRAVSNLIREGKTFQLYSLMQTAKASGMLTLSDSLLQLVKNNLVTPEEAFMKAVLKDEFKMMLDKAGLKLELPTAVE